MNADRLLAHYARIADAPDAIARLRRFILDLAVRGKLVPQDPKDEPASALLKRIAVERARLVKAGDIRKPKPLPAVDEPIFEVPQSWRWTRIREITSDRGQKVPDSNFTYIDVTAIDKAIGVVADPKVLEAKDTPSRARKITRKGDVIYSCVRPYLLNVAVIEVDFDPEPIASTAFAILDAHGFVLPRYLWIVLRSPFMIECVETEQRGQAYPAINDADFAVLPFPLPPLAEQHRIVAKVDELMALCDRLEAARAAREATRDRLTAASLARLNAPDPDSFPDAASFALTNLAALTTRPDQIKPLRQTILNLAVRGKLVPQDPTDEPVSVLLKRVPKMGHERRRAVDSRGPLAQPFEIPSSWHWTSMNECFVVAGGMQKTPLRVPRDNAFPYLGVGNVYRGRLNLAEIKKFQLFDDELERFRLMPDDILVVEGNGSASEIGRCAIWSGEIADCVHQNHIIRCRPLAPKLSTFVVKYLNSPFGIDAMTALAITSSGLYSLSVGKIRTIPVPLPPLAEQHRIVAKVDALMALCDQLEASLTAGADTSRRLLDALLSEALAPADDAIGAAA
jgi:type I restriction enzyme S subunit